MAHYEEKEGFKNITEVRNFLYGTNNRKHSKVYLKVEQHDGHNYLCIWLDNNYTLDEITGDKDYLNKINGFKKHYELKMNKVDYEDVSYTETVQDITSMAWPEISKFHEEDGCDSRSIFSMFRDWAREFEEYFNSEQIVCEHPERNYYDEVEIFTEKKVAEYKEIHKK